MSTHHDIAIIGSGFSGLGMAIRLKQSGREDFVVLESDDGIGGTWWANSYPGCACDVQSHLYSFSFAPNPSWTRMFAPQAEIQRYLADCAQRFDVARNVRLGTEVTGARWDEAAGRWTLSLDGGAEEITARVIVAGIGGLSRPALPDIPGIEDFEGEMWHSARWNHDADLRDRHVAVIGTGASAIQFVPQIAPEVAQLDVYQRTAPWILPKLDRPITRIERAIFRAFPALQQAYRRLIYWRLEARVPGFVGDPRLLKVAEVVAKAHLRLAIRDRALRRKVTPSYTIGCKRILISNDYLPALARPNVDVLDCGVERIAPRGVIGADGVEREVDTIIFGTGFAIQEMGDSVDLVGRDGLALRDAWSARMQAYKGTSIAGFPNFFMLLGPNTGLGHSSVVHMVEAQIAQVMGAIEHMDAAGVAWVDVRPEAQRAFVQRVDRATSGTVWATGGCRSWYVDDRGQNTTLWPDFTFRFHRLAERFESEDFEVAPVPAELPLAA